MKDGARYNLAKEAAIELLDRYKIYGPPVDPLEIARSEGLKIQWFRPNNDKSLEEIAGLLDFEGKTIYVNANNHLNRQTFTVAHELGHWVMHKEEFSEKPGLYQAYRKNQHGERSNDPKEAEANCFAASLLVPLSFLDKLSFLGTKKLSEIFMVSPDVIRHRSK